MLDIRRQERQRSDNISDLMAEIASTEGADTAIIKTAKLIDELRYFLKYEQMGITLFEKPVDDLINIYSQLPYCVL